MSLFMFDPFELLYIRLLCDFNVFYIFVIIPLHYKLQTCWQTQKIYAKTQSHFSGQEIITYHINMVNILVSD
jgi:hypothetical protein